MKLRTLVSSFILASLAAGAASADSAPWYRGPDRDHRDERHDRDHRHDHDHDRDHRHDHDRDRDHRHQGWVDGCPRGLVRSGRECLTPRHAQKKRQWHVGERFDPRQYQRVSDPRRYNLEQRGNWNYYQDQDQVYRVDNHTQKVLGVLSLMQAFSK